MADHLEGLSSDDEETSTDITNFNLEKGQRLFGNETCQFGSCWFVASVRAHCANVTHFYDEHRGEFSD